MKVATRAFSLDAHIDRGPVTSNKQPPQQLHLLGRHHLDHKHPLPALGVYGSSGCRLKCHGKENVFDALSPGGYTVLTAGAGAAGGEPWDVSNLPTFLSFSLEVSDPEKQTLSPSPGILTTDIRAEKS